MRNRIIFARNLLGGLRQREIEAAAAQVAAETGLVHRPLAEGETVAGSYRKRLNLASGRFAMIDDGLGFSLVPGGRRWNGSSDARLNLNFPHGKSISD